MTGFVDRRSCMIYLSPPVELVRNRSLAWLTGPPSTSPFRATRVYQDCPFLITAIASSSRKTGLPTSSFIPAATSSSRSTTTYHEYHAPTLWILTLGRSLWHHLHIVEMGKLSLFVDMSLPFALVLNSFPSLLPGQRECWPEWQAPATSNHAL